MEDKADLNSCPVPLAWDGLSWRLEGNGHLLPLWLLADLPLRTPTSWGEKQ